jgi:hypothetical protein
MRIEAWTFGGLAATLFSFAIGYAVWHDVTMVGVDWVGVIMLGLAGAFCAMIALFFGVVARRIDLRPEDQPEAEVADGAGEVGFFSPGSYWPLGIGAAAAVTAVALAYQSMWLITAGGIAVVLATCGLLFEYHTGTRRVEPYPRRSVAARERTSPRPSRLERTLPGNRQPAEQPPARIAVPAGPRRGA